MAISLRNDDEIGLLPRSTLYFLVVRHIKDGGGAVFKLACNAWVY